MLKLTQTAAPGTPDIADIVENFALLDDWDDRYRYVIDMGKGAA